MALGKSAWLPGQGKPDAAAHRGSQYSSEQLMTVIVCMSRSENVWDNAAMDQPSRSRPNAGRKKYVLKRRGRIHRTQLDYGDSTIEHAGRRGT